MKPFNRIVLPLHTETELRRFMAQAGVPAERLEATIKHLMEYEARCEHWRNQEWHVAVDKQTEHAMGPDVEVWHLSIKRHDRRPCHDWRKLQAIKTAICGPQCEAVELYPAESRVMDTANSYHLFAFPNTPMLPFGIPDGMRTDAPMFGNAKQRAGSGA